MQDKSGCMCLTVWDQGRWCILKACGSRSRPAAGIETLDARISTIKNRLTASSRAAQVIARVADAIVIDPSTDPVYTYNSGRVLIDHLGHFTFSEGFAGAFSEDEAGQTTPTEIIFQVSSLPRNTQLRFPAIIGSQTGASLTTADGEDVTLASGGTRNRVVYTFSSGASSRTAVDVFSFSPVLERTGPGGTGTGFYQVTIGPVGAAKPTRALPSKEAPRYEELLLPALPALSAAKTFLFPVERGVDTQSFTVSNTATGAAPLTIRAFDEAGDLLDGSDVANERTHVLESHQTMTFDLGTMFGPGATAETVASVAIESRNDRPVATKIGTTAGGAYAMDSQAPVEPAYFQFDRRNAGEMPLVSVAGAGAADFESRWTLMDTGGVEQASAVQEAGAGGAVRGSLEALFDMTAAAVPLAGYVRVESIEAQFRGNLVDNPGEETLAVPALWATGSSWTVFPYFVIGGGYNTVVTLINASDETAAVTATAFDAAGVEIAPGFTTRIPPRTMEELDWAAILGTGSLRQGYFAPGCRAGRSTAPVRQRAASGRGGPHRGAGQPGGGGVDQRERRRVLLHAGPLGRGRVHGPVDPQRGAGGNRSPHRSLRGGRRVAGYGRAHGCRARHPHRAATGAAARAGLGRWRLRPRIVDVDPDAGPRLAWTAGRHPAAASGRADGALEGPRA